MTQQPPKAEPASARILFLFSDTGGGHRSAAEAIIEALQLEFGERIKTEMVDIFKDYAPRPFNRLPNLYPEFVRVPSLWGLGYRLSNGPRRVSALQASVWPYVRRSIRSLVAQHPCDLIVSVHPLATAPVLRALGEKRPPYITVVTDLVTTHAFWYHKQSDLCIVPSSEAARRGFKNGLRPEQVKVVGLPVADRFCKPLGNPTEIRQRLGWPLDRPMVVLVGGGDGMGPLGQTARTIAAAGLKVGLAVITGRNAKLKAELDAVKWSMPTFIYGFVREMPDFMRAADVLVTKAGPGTISEALNAGLPMILYSRLPGQEDGNVTYVTDNHAGVWAPHPDQIVGALRRWLERPQEYEAARQACIRLARPDAARQIARILIENIPQPLETA